MVDIENSAVVVEKVFRFWIKFFFCKISEMFFLFLGLKFYVYGRNCFLSGFFLFVCTFNRILCFTVKSFFYDAKYRRFFGFHILSEDLDDLGGFLKNAFILSLFLKG